MEETRKVRKENSEATDDLTKELHGYNFQQATTQKNTVRESYVLVLQIFKINYI